MNPQNRKYFAIIVHYGDSAATSRAVESLLNTAQHPSLCVLVDHADQPYRHQHPHTIVFRPAVNRGYAAGINRGLGVLLSQGIQGQDIVICLNNDVLVSPTALKQIRAWWDSHAINAAISVSTQDTFSHLSGDGTVNLLTGRTSFIPVTKSKPSLFWRLLTSFYQLRYLHGTLIAAPYLLFMKTHGLPEDYFLYWEDPLFARLLTKKNIPFLALNHICVAHSNKSTDTQSDNHIYYLVRNGAMFLEQHTPLPWRIYWRAVNRLRLIYHQRPGHSPVVKQALSHARQRFVGKRT